MEELPLEAGHNIQEVVKTNELKVNHGVVSVDDVMRELPYATRIVRGFVLGLVGFLHACFQRVLNTSFDYKDYFLLAMNDDDRSIIRPHHL